jgi:hypothetical protein
MKDAERREAEQGRRSGGVLDSTSDEAAPDRGLVAQGDAVAEGEEGRSAMAYGRLQ